MLRKGITNSKPGRWGRSRGRGTEAPLGTLRSPVDDFPGGPVHVWIVDDQPEVTLNQQMLRSLVQVERQELNEVVREC